MSYMSEPDVVLMCGCIASPWGAITRNGKEWVICERHETELQEVIRKATLADLVEQIRNGKPSVQGSLW